MRLLLLLGWFTAVALYGAGVSGCPDGRGRGASAGGVQVRLGGEWKRSAERFFGIGFENVMIHAGGDEARRAGARAMACGGEHIYLDGDLRLSDEAFRELIGHELTHVIQQRQGRVGASNAMVAGEWALNDDPQLEREAVDLGRRFARGEHGVVMLPQGHAAQLGAHPAAGVVQRSVSVGGRPLARTADLSNLARLVLQLTDGGMEWFAWAVRPGAENYAFASEQDLIVAANTILHGDAVTLLPTLGLKVHAARLMEMAEADLRILAGIEAGGGNNSAELAAAQDVLARHKLYRQQDLAVGQQFLSEAGVSAAPVFQSLTLADLIALTELAANPVNGEAGPAIEREAAAFAVTRARNTQAFIDWYLFYLAVATGAGEQTGTAESRSQVATARATAMTPLLFSALTGPAARDNVPSPERLSQVLGDWFRTGRRLGFMRISQAVSAAQRNSAVAGHADEHLEQALNAYLASVEACVAENRAVTATTSQGGDAYLFEYATAGGAAATVRWDAVTGAISLESFRQPH